MNGKAIINRLNFGRSAIAMLKIIYWEEGINGKAILNSVNLGRSAIEMLTRI